MTKVRRHEGDINLSDRRQAWMEEALGQETRALLEEDERYFCTNPCRRRA